MPYIQQGERLTCESGCHIATSKRDIERHSPCLPEDFDWQIQAPETGHHITPCPICGAPYVKGLPSGSMIAHIDGEWRPALPEGAC